MKELQRYKVYAGGKKRQPQGRNKKGRFEKKNKGTNERKCFDVSKMCKHDDKKESINEELSDNEFVNSCDKGPVSNILKNTDTLIRLDQENGIGLDLRDANDKHDRKICADESDQEDAFACPKDEKSDRHICNMANKTCADRVMQADSEINLEESEDSGIDTVVKRTYGQNYIESDTDACLECDLVLPSNLAESEKSSQCISTNDLNDNTCHDEIIPDLVLNEKISNTCDEEKQLDDNFLSTNSLESLSKPQVKEEIIEEANQDTMYSCSDESGEEVEFISDLGMCDRPDKFFTFSPLEINDKQNLCTKMNISYRGRSYDGRINRHEFIGVPSRIKKISGDGNCFFRAISYVISGTESNHAILRNATVKHLLKTNDMFKNTLGREFRTVREYVLERRIIEDGTWATDTEISALANLIDIDIYSYNDQVPCWQLYSAKKPGRINVQTSDKGIHIQYTDNVHFNVVESVNTVIVDSLEQTRITNDESLTINTKISQIAQGTFNQGHTRFGYSAGKQCVANSLSALLYSKVKSANGWNSEDLDRILINGDELYRFIRHFVSREQEYLLISDLPEHLETYDELFEIKCCESVSGLLDGDENILAQCLSLPLKQALERELCNDSDACFLTFGGSTFMVISSQDGYFIFDSHSRNRHGLLSDDGHSVLQYTPSWEDDF